MRKFGTGVCCSLLFALSLLWAYPAFAVDGRFDLLGPKIDVRVTRNGVTLPIASVPNLQPGDKLWIHPDLPSTQSVKYLLICAFLRGVTNPPPEDWFYRIETWNKKITEEGTFITVPQEAQQAVMFLAPETGGDFSTLKSAVRGTPGVFVRASQDLAEAGFEQSRIERYLADIRRVPPGDPDALQKHSDLLARTLALKPNTDCFKRPIDQQFTCLTQTGTQILMDDGHGQNVASALANGPSSDLINQASYTQLAGAGTYSAYVGAIVDLVRIMGSLHTAQYRYIPAVAFPQGAALNLRLNTPPSFHNPKSVLVIGLPSVQPTQGPPLVPADPSHTTCLLEPSVVLPVDGAPLVFSTDFATDLVLHLNTPPNAPTEADIPLAADAYEGGLALEQTPEHHVLLHDERTPLATAQAPGTAGVPQPPASRSPEHAEPVLLTGTVKGRWGFNPFVGPTLKLQQLPGGDWHIISHDGASPDVIAGKTAQLFVSSSGSACVHTVEAQVQDGTSQTALTFRPAPSADQPNLLAISLPSNHEISPGNLDLHIQQFGQPKPDGLSARTFTEPPQIDGIQLPAAGRMMLLTGDHLASIDKVQLGDLTFRPRRADDAGDPASPGNLFLSLPESAPLPPTHPGEHLVANVTLNDGRQITTPLVVQAPRPSVSLLSRTFDPIPGSTINLSSPEDLPLAAHISFTLKSRAPFPRNGQVEVETLDGTLRAVLTLAPSGGLILQDPHTVVASLDPSRSFGPSAFGALQLRAVFPESGTKGRHADTNSEPNTEAASAAAQTSFAVSDTSQDLLDSSDWVPLGTLVRLPVLAHLQCSSEPGTGCSLSGTNLFLLQAVSADPSFTEVNPVPDGFTGSSLPVPHPAGSAATLFVRLRDDPTPVDTATLSGATTITPQTGSGHARGSRN